MNTIYIAASIIIGMLFLVILWRYQLHRQRRTTEEKLAQERRQQQQVIEMMMALTDGTNAFVKAESMTILAITNFDHEGLTAKQKLRESAQRLYHFCDNISPRFIEERGLVEIFADLVEQVTEYFELSVDFAVSEGIGHDELDFTECYWRK